MRQAWDTGATATTTLTLGRWTSRDPIGERGGINLYAYVSNNALSIIDALGHEGIKNGKWEDVFRTFQLMKKKCDKCCKCAPDKALCKKEAQRIADNIRKAVKYNSGRAQCTGKHQVEGYLCWDWSKAFEDAVKCAKTKKWSVEQVKFDCQSQDPNKEFLVHFFIRLRACGKTDDNCVVMIDDGFFSDGTYHVPPWPDDATVSPSGSSSFANTIHLRTSPVSARWKSSPMRIRGMHASVSV